MVTRPVVMQAAVTRPVVIALPGFTRGPQHLELLAAACEGAGLDCIRPVLAPRWLPVLYMAPSRLRRMAVELTPACDHRSVVVAGHSAGGAAGAALAAEFLAVGVDLRGLVLIDGVDSPNHLIARSLPRLLGVRIAAVLAPASPCNRQAELERYLAASPTDSMLRVEVVPGAGHGDIEGDGIGLYRRACRDSSDPRIAAEFRSRVMSAIMWAGMDSGASP